MLSNLLDHFHNTPPTSKLYNEDTFYKAFIQDIKKTKSELIIESAYMTTRRIHYLLPYLQNLKNNRIRVVVNTRDPEEHNQYLAEEARRCLSLLLEIGVQVIFSESLHRKMAIVDRSILWEGSLNILSQNDSQEIMRRLKSTHQSWQMVRFAGLDGLIN